MSTSASRLVIVEPVQDPSLAMPPRTLRVREGVAVRVLMVLVVLDAALLFTLAPLPSLWTLLNLAVLSCAAINWWWHLLRVARAAWLGRHGLTAQAEVMAVAKHGFFGHSYTLRFSDSEGSEHTATYTWPVRENARGSEVHNGMFVRLETDPMIAEGARLVAFHSAQRPSNCLLRPHVHAHVRFEWR